MTRASIRRSRRRATPCGRLSRAGSPRRRAGLRTTSGRTGSSTSAAARCPTSRSSSRTSARSSGWTPSPTPWRASSARSRRSRRPTRRSTSSSARRSSSTSTTPRAVSPSCIASYARAGASSSRRTGRWSTTRTRSTCGAGPAPASSACSPRTARGIRLPSAAGAGTAASLAMLNGLYLDHVLRRGPLRPLRRPVVSARQPARPGARRAAPGAARRAARDARRELPRRRREARVTPRPRHGRRRLHRLEPRRRRSSSGATTSACSTTSRPGRRANLASLGREVEVVEGDLRSYERVHTAVRGRRARLPPGRARVGAALGAGPATSTAVNVEGTLNVLLAARDEDVRRVVFASSSSVYGNAERHAALGVSSAPNPISPYAVAKLAAERFCV